MYRFRRNPRSLFAVVAILASIGVTSVAMSEPGLLDSENADVISTRDQGAKVAEAPPVESSQARAASWGVFAYESDRGLACVQGGIISNGEVGAYRSEGFRPYQARDGVGNCGDFTDALTTMGGLAFGAVAPASGDIADRTKVVYGLLSPGVTSVNVTYRGASESLRVHVAKTPKLDGADRVFIAPLPAEAPLSGVVVTFELNDGERSVSTL